MKKVIGVRVNDSKKISYFLINDLIVKKGDFVIVSTDRGEQFCEVITDIVNVDESKLNVPLGDVIRIASDSDVVMNERNLDDAKKAIEDAKVNAQINKLDNTLFYAGDMKDILNQEFIEKHGRPDVIITDPPRAGMHTDVINTILFAAPQRIVYVSCNPATQARDLQLLDTDYRVVAVQPVDMFPQTHHVENVVLLERR